MMIKKYIRTGDIIVIAAVLLTALVLACVFASTNIDADSFYIKSDGLTEVYPLDKNTAVDIVSCGIALKVEVLDKKVRVISSECPDGICEKTGSIDKNGETIVCLPARVIVGIISDNRSGYEADGVVG